ncbi:hypothetical protein [Mycobacteroides abscessus]|uniref:hypothetical protein n=1 Tax=Mycobacteroides abscessus TaxID=36809 RepID=UPI000C269FFA|nr:hypothetical protein [Mycobacteroides abscessus]
MSDPAIEGVKNAAGENHWWITRLDDQTIANVCEYAEAAAREALRPIREKWEELLGPYATRLVKPEATGAIKVLEAFAPLIFTTEELNQ